MPNDPHIVYLIDDNAVDRIILQKLIAHTRPDWKLSCFEDGSTALAVIRATPPDLVLTDYQLPALNGVELARIVREAGYSFPIVALSAGLPDRIREIAPKGLFDLVLGKPISVEALAQIGRLLA